MWAELPELLTHILNWKTMLCVCTWLKFHKLIKASIWTWKPIQGMNVYRRQRRIYHFCWDSYSNIWASWFFCPLQSFLLSDTTLAVACPSLLPPLAFPHQIFCSRTTAAPFLQSSPLIHTTDILAHRLVSLALSLSLIQRALQTLQVWAISASSARAFITGHEARCFYCTDRQTAREGLFRSLTWRQVAISHCKKCSYG